MDDYLFENIKDMAKYLEEDLLKHSSSRYVLNSDQLQKMIAIINLIRESGGRIDKIDIEPLYEVGGVTAYFGLIDICGDQIENAFEILKESSAIGIEPMDDGMCVSITIPDLFSET